MARTRYNPFSSLKHWLTPFQLILPFKAQQSSASLPPRIRECRAPRRKAPGVDAPELKSLWVEIRREYFPERTEIDRFTVLWSTRTQKNVLASCNSHRERVQVAVTFKREDCSQYLPALLYHEMCHAVLGVAGKRNGRRVIHGRDFYTLEARHPGIAALNLWIRSGGWRSAVQKDRARERREVRLSQITKPERTISRRGGESRSSAVAASSARDRFPK